ncbi:MgtC/SapB family protein [Chitinophaga sp. CB10]|uniref:MgtC/SapB family protein n=1 Tax=Chitinophaga sp. CB10 TaxID=1891659 RepID=UPI0025BE9FE7|nr:MgtC/SapB family protein [Chitinophaga sp. CB10]
MEEIIATIKEDYILKVALSLLMGAVIGLEREYKRKAAGMRTMTLICVSSAVFTILSVELGYPNSPDRVASNILTGVGFIGAGVIFKGEFAIDGITTAASIWIAAAIGMAIGMNEYWLALFTLAGAIAVLIALEYTERYIARINDKRVYCIQLIEPEMSYLELEKNFDSQKLKYKRMMIVRKENRTEVNYAIHGRREQMEALNMYLHQSREIHEYQIQTNPF